MSLLDMCRRVMAETGWPAPANIASNLEGTAQQIFAIANTELRLLSAAHQWPQLEVEYDFATVATQSVYFWPSDFRVLAPHSIFDASEYYRIKGSMPLQDWHLRKYGLLGNISRQAFRVSYPLGAPAIEITPTPTSVNSLVAVYYSSELARTAGGVSKPWFTLDDDVSKIPELLVEMGIKWRFRRAKGLDYSAELAEYNGTVTSHFAQYLAPSEIPIGGRRWQDDGITGGYVRDSGFGV